MCQNTPVPTVPSTFIESVETKGHVHIQKSSAVSFNHVSQRLFCFPSCNHIPGSRSYSGLVDTLADSSYLHPSALTQVSFKHCPYKCRWLTNGLFHLMCHVTSMLFEQWQPEGRQNIIAVLKNSQGATLSGVHGEIKAFLRQYG